MAKQPALWTSHQRINYLIHLLPQVGKAFHLHVAKYVSMTDCQLSDGQMMLLSCLSLQPRPMHDLAELLRVKMPTMTEMIQRLVKLRLVTRSQDLKDRRLVRIQITSFGRRRLKNAQARWNKALRAWLKTLDNAKQQKLVNAFQIIEQLLVNPLHKNLSLWRHE